MQFSQQCYNLFSNFTDHSTMFMHHNYIMNLGDKIGATWVRGKEMGGGLFYSKNRCFGNCMILSTYTFVGGWCGNHITSLKIMYTVRLKIERLGIFLRK